VFGAMLDREAGGFLLAPLDVQVPAGRRYLPARTSSRPRGTRRPAGSSCATCSSSARGTRGGALETHRRAPTDWEAEHILLRTMRCVNGSVEMHMECEPMMDYGRRPVQWEYTGTGYHEAVGRAEGWDVELHLNTNLRMGFEDSRARARTTLQGGRLRVRRAELERPPRPTTYDEAYERVVRTPTSGTSGSRAASSPTTRGGPTCSAAR
jgi:hypothetical protein